jgi:hypothetical protein
MIALLIFLGLLVLLAVASLAGLGADSRDPDWSLFRAPREGPPVFRRGFRARY